MKKSNAGLSVAFLFDDTLDSDDGVSQYVKLVGSWLGGQGHEVTYLVGQSRTTAWAGGKVYSLSKNLKLTWNGNRVSVSVIPRLGLIKRVLSGKDFDVIHVMVPYSPFMAQRVMKRAAPKTAVVGTVHIYPANWLSRFGSRLLKIAYGKSLRRFNEVISVSVAAQEYAKDFLGLDTAIVPNTVDLDKFEGSYSAHQDNKKIVFLGRLVERKGCMQLLRAFNKLHESMPEVKLEIAGGGPLRGRMERYVKDNDLSSSVKFLGHIDESDKPAFLAGADIACFPSMYGECFGIVLLEAMAAGSKVVLGGDNPGYRSVLGSQPELLIDPKDESAFAERLAKLLTDDRAAGVLHAWQDKEVKQYDINIVGSKILDVYRQAIAKAGKKGNN